MAGAARHRPYVEKPSVLFDDYIKCQIDTASARKGVLTNREAEKLGCIVLFTIEKHPNNQMSIKWLASTLSAVFHVDFFAIAPLLVFFVESRNVRCIRIFRQQINLFSVG